MSGTGMFSKAMQLVIIIDLVTAFDEEMFSASSCLQVTNRIISCSSLCRKVFYKW